MKLIVSIVKILLILYAMAVSLINSKANDQSTNQDKSGFGNYFLQDNAIESSMGTHSFNKSNTQKFPTNNRPNPHPFPQPHPRPYYIDRNRTIRPNPQPNPRPYIDRHHQINPYADRNDNTNTDDRTRYHPYHNPNPARTTGNCRKEPILAHRKPKDPNDPIERNKETLKNLAERAGIGLPQLDLCIVQLADRQKKIGKEYAFVRSWLATWIFEQPETVYPEFIQKKLAGKKIIMPTAVYNRAHWICMVADTTTKTIEHYNSHDPTLSRYHREAAEFRDKFQRILTTRNRMVPPNEHIDATGWRVERPSYTTPIQSDMINCGAYALMYVDGKLNDGKLTFDAKGDVFLYRDEMLQKYVDMITKKPKRKSNRVTIQNKNQNIASNKQNTRNTTNQTRNSSNANNNQNKTRNTADQNRRNQNTSNNNNSQITRIQNKRNTANNVNNRSTRNNRNLK